MLPSLSNFVSLDNRTVQVLLGVVVVLVLVGLLFGLYRLVFAHRLRIPGGGKGRAPRLGVVDVYSVDGQRQLVIVRRDNVEHLLMIGGPNDLVVESQIFRAAANGANPVKATPPAEPVAEAAPLPRPAAPAVATPRHSALRSTTIPMESAPAVPVAPVELSPAASEPAGEPRVRPAARLDSPVVSKAPDVAAPSPRAEVFTAAEPKAEPQPRRPLSKPLATIPRPNLPSAIAPRPRSAELPAPVEVPKPAAPNEPGKAPDVVIVPPAPSQASPGEAPSVVVPPVSSENPGRNRAEDTFYDLESLEAEMARLLGRDG